MLTESQLDNLTEEDREYYLNLTEKDDIDSFEYFYGYAHGTKEEVVVTNEEVALYQKTTDSISLKAVCGLIGFVPHRGQQPLIHAVDNLQETRNCFVFAAGRRVGKSASISMVVLRELLVPFSATVLVAPVFTNAKVIFNEVLKLVRKLNIPIKSMNKGQFNFELDNGAKFTANSEANIEAALGGHFSLLIYEEAQSIGTLDNIHKQMLAPTQLDYGVRPSGILYGRTFVIGTFRGTDNVLYDYYTREESFDNWKSFTAPSMTNPTLPKSYFENMRTELGDMLYKQEILAIPMGHDNNVFYAFDYELNTFDPDTRVFNKDSRFIVGIDIGWSDSTAAVWVYREVDTYYIVEAYSENNKATKEHVGNYTEVEDRLAGQVDMRYGDPAAAQTLNDMRLTYNYDTVNADNAVADSIKYINHLLTPTGANARPKLYISNKLTELHRQISRVKYKPDNSKSSKDPFIKDTKGTHWDLIAALRYALYSDKFNMAATFIVSA